MITVHHLENSRSQRIPWLLEELGLEYEIRHYRRNKKTMLAPPELKAIHPLGKSPVITDGEQVVAESGAIIEYLIDHYGNGRLRPEPCSPERLQYNYWLHYAEGSLMPLMVMTLVFAKVAQAPLLVRPIAKAICKQVHKTFLDPNIEANLKLIESTLGQQPWFAGEEISGADMQMSFALEAVVHRAGGQLPHMADFLQRIQARPAYQRALERTGPLTFSY